MAQKDGFMITGVYPGSFDPVTYGHIDIIKRASLLCDRLIVGILINRSKSPLFDIEERTALLREAVKDIPNVEIRTFSGLTIDFAHECGASFMIRGLRAVTDFDYELQLSQTNRKLAPDVDTVFLTTSLQYAYLSSSIVKEVASYGGDISEFVPPFVAKELLQKYTEKE